MPAFGARLRAAMDMRGPLCVGIDPHAQLLAAWGLSDDPAGVASFCQIVVDALADRVAVFKPQSAFFERFGSSGAQILESTIRQLREAGALILLDAKRGDIGSTVAAYADAYLNPSMPMYVDAITASPFLGVGSLAPMFAEAHRHGGGVFVLALTSNKEGPEVQHARLPDGRTVAQSIIDEISQLNVGEPGLGSIGAVVGATIGDTGHDLSGLGGPILVPGLGAQGGKPDDLRAIFPGNLSAVLPSYSREVLGAGPDVASLRRMTSKINDELMIALGSPK
ncbi:orotidine 5'-phosphate decarboxylase [Rhizocola hellebori]|uniref:Orotidine 5'-phosphate decarboxylase n=1 Tax=Rhizocola hellebori TaxID=1392758 RepID=A0A8J3VLX3_9ACTN|nr:orotidine-5'-phosphate decarboxylase [Rhizocola hellebori]GIH10603.1 orotidine 5'-phosphate decarboxylase [Rhizocola hellebori]